MSKRPNATLLRDPQYPVVVRKLEIENDFGEVIAIYSMVFHEPLPANRPGDTEIHLGATLAILMIGEPLGAVWGPTPATVPWREVVVEGRGMVLVTHDPDEMDALEALRDYLELRGAIVHLMFD